MTHTNTARPERTIRKTWVAFGENGAVATIHALDEGYGVRFLGRDDYHGIYETIEVAKRAVSAQRSGDFTFEEH